MLTIGDKFPEFKLKAVVSLEKGKEFQRRHRRGLPRQVEGRVLLADGLHLRLPDRDRRVRQAQPRLRRPRRAGAGRQHRQRVRPPGLAQRPPRPEEPAVPDARRHQARAVERAGHPAQQDGVALRATFIVDPEGIIRCVSVNDLSVGRNVDEVLRVLDALQTDELCPCNWKKGEPTLSAACMTATDDERRRARALRDATPEPARDIKLNLQAVLAAEGSLTPAQRWGVAVASAAAARNPRAARRGDRGRARRGRRGGDRGRAGRRRADGDEQRLLPVPPHGRERRATCRSRRACA